MTMTLLMLLMLSSSLMLCEASFIIVSPPSFRTPTNALTTTTAAKMNLSGGNNEKLTQLPKGINPFEKSASKFIDVQGIIRELARRAVETAMSDGGGPKLLEIEFPPLLGGDKSKSQFDDFDNIQELDRNKDWTMQVAPPLAAKPGCGDGKTWLVFPDLKECELARSEWAGQRYQNAATFTTIEAATMHLAGQGSYDAPWGAALASGASKLMGKGKDGSDGDVGWLGDQTMLDPLVDENSPPALALVVQPGNGGPVEDWINCEKIYEANPETCFVIINGALDKVKSGYYPAVFFPKLALTVDRFYKRFESAFYLKPLSDKGVYGWLYRVYPEPWQVVLQTIETNPKSNQMEVIDTVVSVSKDRPSYNDAVGMLVAANAKIQAGARQQ